jgi:hypothetical protein
MIQFLGWEAAFVTRLRMAGVDVERTLINSIAASRGFTPKLLRYLLFQPCPYCRFTSYIAQ